MALVDVVGPAGVGVAAGLLLLIMITTPTIIKSAMINPDFRCFVHA